MSRQGRLRSFHHLSLGHLDLVDREQRIVFEVHLVVLYLDASAPYYRRILHLLRQLLLRGRVFDIEVGWNPLWVQDRALFPWRQLLILLRHELVPRVLLTSNLGNFRRPDILRRHSCDLNLLRAIHVLCIPDPRLQNVRRRLSLPLLVAVALPMRHSDWHRPLLRFLQDPRLFVPLRVLDQRASAVEEGGLRLLIPVSRRCVPVVVLQLVHEVFRMRLSLVLIQQQNVVFRLEHSLGKQGSFLVHVLI